jgi:hypothetical protein
LTFKKELNELFNENLIYYMDCDFYNRLFEKCGHPIIDHTINIASLIHSNQVSQIMEKNNKIVEVSTEELEYLNLNLNI